MDIIKIAVDLSKGGSGTPNILEVYRAGKTDEQKSYSNAIRTAETNANDIALEEIKQNADLSNKRLLWEIKQYESKEAHDLKLIETAKEIVQPLLGEGLKIAGGFAKNKMAATSATNTNSVCPACNKPFYVDPSQEQVQCPNCNAVLSKNPPSQEQPSTEQRTEPKKEPISELPKAEDF
jgi:rubrerythrin